MSIQTFLRGVLTPKIQQRNIDSVSEYNLLTAGFTGVSHLPDVPLPYIIVPPPYLALRNSVVYSCVKLLVESVSALTIRLIDAKTKEEITNHPVVNLFRSPNDDDTWSEFLESVLTSYFLWGNAYVEKETKGGRIVALYPMCATRTNALCSATQTLYEFLPYNGKPIVFDASDIMHLRMFGVNDMQGLPPVWAANKAIRLAMTQEEMATQNYQDGVRPDYVITLPPEKVLERLKDIESDAIKNDKALIQNQIEGARTRRGLYVPFGYQIQPYQANFAQAQFAETRDFQLAEISRIFRVPLSKLNVSTKAINQSAAEGEQLSFFTDTLRPVLVKLEQKLAADLLSPNDRTKYVIKFRTRDLLRGDTAATTDQYTKLWAIGGLTTNEIRDLEDRPAFDDPKADKPNWPVNMTTETIPGAPQLTNPADPKAPAPEVPTAPVPKQASLVVETTQQRTENAPVDIKKRSLNSRKKAAERAKPLFHEAVSRIVRKEKASVLKDAKSILSKRSRENLTDRLRSMYDGEMKDFITNSVAGPVDVLLASTTGIIESELDYTFDAGQLALMRKQYADIYTRQYIDSSLGQLVDLIDGAENEADILPAFEERFNEWENGTPEAGLSRADKASEQESNKGANVFAKLLYKTAGVSMLRWVVSAPCDYCDPFTDFVFSTSADITVPPIHHNCQCDIEPA